MPKAPAILVVDDERAVLEIIQEVLLTRGYEVDTAVNGLDALACLEESRYDLILSDVVMPDMGGMELLRQISLRYPETMAIMLTGYANIQDAVAAIKLGAFDYIAKPVYPEVLLLTVERALKFKELRQARRELEWTLKGAETLGLQILELAPETEEFQVLEKLRHQGREIKDHQNLAQLFLAQAQQLVQATRGSLFLYHPEHAELICVARSDAAAEQCSRASVSAGEGVMGLVVQHGRPLLVPDITLDPRFFHPQRSQRYRSTSFIVVPIIGEKLWGVINLTDRQDLAPFTPRDLFLTWLLARILADLLQSQAREQENVRLGQTLVATQSELLQVKDYLNHVSKSVSIGLAVLDSKLRLCSANPAFAKLVHWDEHHIQSQDFLSSLINVSSRDREQLAGALQKVLQGQSSLELNHVVLTHPQRGKRFLAVRMVGYYPEPEHPRILLVLEDQTELEQMRQRLAFCEHLAIMGKLSACVVHELNNPLDGVMRYISLALLKKENGGEVERYLGEAQRGLHKISQAIRAMLQVTNPHRILKTQDSLLGQLQEAVKILLFQANDQGVDISLEVSPWFDQVLVANDLYMVFVNVIKNALQAMPRGGSLQIKGIEHLDRLVISFTDTGEGIAPQDLKKIFKPFFTTKQESQGLGLGLSICEKIIERYQGHIGIKSALGQGTTVTIELPWPVADWGTQSGAPHRGGGHEV